MKLKTRLAVAFMIITIVPMILIFVSFFAINDHQARSFTKEYGLTEQVDLLSAYAFLQSPGKDGRFHHLRPHPG